MFVEAYSKSLRHTLDLINIYLIRDFGGTKKHQLAIQGTLGLSIHEAFRENNKARDKLSHKTVSHRMVYQNYIFK